MKWILMWVVLYCGINGVGFFLVDHFNVWNPIIEFSVMGVAIVAPLLFVLWLQHRT